MANGNHRDITDLPIPELRSLRRALRDLKSGGQLTPDKLWTLSVIERELDERGVMRE